MGSGRRITSSSTTSPTSPGELRAKPTTRGRTSSAGRATTGATTRSRRRATTRSSTRLTRRHPRARARDRRDGRDLQRQGRDPSGQHAERRRRASGLPGRPRRRGARRCHARRHRGPSCQAASAHVRGLVEMLGEYQALAAETLAGRATTASGRSAPTRSSARSTSPSASTTPPPRHTAPTCPTGSSGARRERAPARRRRRQHEDGRRRRSRRRRAGSRCAGCGDIHNAGSPEPALVEIVRATTAALDAAGATAADLAAAAFSLAGADWPEDFERLRRELRAAFATSRIVNDAIGGLRCGSDELVGVSVVIGTYRGRRPQRRREVFHLGFWPEDGSVRARLRWRSPPSGGTCWARPDTSLSRVHSSAGSARTRRSSSTLSRGSAASTSRSPAASPTPSSTRRRRAIGVAISIVETVAGRMGDYATVCATAPASSVRRFRSSSAAVSSGTRRRSSARRPFARPGRPAGLPGCRSRRRGRADRRGRVGARPDLGQLRSWLSASVEPGLTWPGSGWRRRRRSTRTA